jgi:hypothetical protein
MMTLEKYLSNTIKQFTNINQSTFFALFLLIIINSYGLYKNTLGKLFSLMIVIYILNNNITIGIASFLIILLLNNNNSIENFENEKKDDKDDNNKDKNDKDPKDIHSSVPKTNDNSESNILTDTTNNENSEINDPIASFKKLHCKNGKAMKDGVEINVSDMTTTFPQLKFNLENEKCNPCEDNCRFKITSSKELITVEESLRPKSSSPISNE